MAYDQMTDGELMMRAGKGDDAANRVFQERANERSADYQEWQSRNPGRPATAYGL